MAEIVNGNVLLGVRQAATQLRVESGFCSEYPFQSAKSVWAK